MGAKSTTLRCPVCGKSFDKFDRCIRAEKKRSPSVVLTCSKKCCDARKKRAAPEILNPREFFYLVGAVLGDGCVGKRALRIAVGVADREYAEILVQSFTLGLGVVPTIEHYRAARSLSVNLGFLSAPDLFRGYKEGPLWNLQDVRYPEMVLAGLCDTDGGWEKKKGRRNTWAQKANDSQLSKYPFVIRADHPDGTVLKFRSVAEAARELGCCRKSISNCLNGLALTIRSGWSFSREKKPEGTAGLRCPKSVLGGCFAHI